MTATPGSAFARPAEVALGAVTVATVLGFARLFDGDDFVLPLLVSAVVAHLVPVFARRRGWGLPRAALLAAGCFVLLTAWLFYLDTTFAGVPTLATLSEARAELAEGWTLFREVVAPAPTEPGFLVAACFGVWLAAFLADWAAFRLWSSFEAIVPSATLFVFTSILADAKFRLPATVLYLSAALAFLLLHRIARQEQALGWLGSADADGGSVMLRSGAVLCAGAVLVAVVVGPRLPGVDEQPVWDVNDRGGEGGSRVTLSPMVDIRTRLVDQSDEEVFTVRSPVRAYWRLTSLDTFDGSIWKSKGDFQSASGPLPSAVATDAARVEAQQQVVMKALAALWLPAAYEPAAIDTGDSDAEVVYEPESATLIVGNELTSSDGLVYEVTSAVPSFTAEQLGAAPPTVPTEIAERYLELPDDFSATATDEAARITAGLQQPYDKALALQDFFRENFTYSTDVGRGHSVDAVEEFLTTRIGYCEQFAGTYAAMARSVGLPARVAVGFTPGDVDPIDPELYHVRGEHAHAWPEVYLQDFGWVAFEPTVSRGIPGGEPYTGVPEPIDTDDDDQAPTTTTSTTPTGAPAPSTPGTFDAEDFAGIATAGGDAPDDPPSPWPRRVALGAAVAVALVLLYVGVVLVAKRARRGRRRHGSAGDRRLAVRTAWSEALEALAVARLTPRPDETEAEIVARIPPGWGLDRRLLDDLAEAATAAAYAPTDPSPQQAGRADEAARSIEDAVTRVTTWQRRWAAALDPRPLLPRRRPQLVMHDAALRPEPPAA